MWLFIYEHQLSDEILHQLASSKMKLTTDFLMATYDKDILIQIL